ncbi:DUF3967 domain-containing protein [Bacillus weihaiensis]|uniref:DUF3967 domain-containing protein n=1 Tax=Bacillus weihaiensis TaxID=1547283 RepID=UPI002352FCDB|nr:DUF3967 domain-containing protein [Bacillus weihaiensis]
MLFELKSLIDKTRDRDNAIKAILLRYKADDNAINTLTVNRNEGDKEVISQVEVKEVKETVRQQNELLQELMKKMDQQQKYIEERSEKQGERQEKRDSLLMESLRESQETKQLLLAAKESGEKYQKGIFRWLFRKYIILLFKEDPHTLNY